MIIREAKKGDLEQVYGLFLQLAEVEDKAAKKVGRFAFKIRTKKKSFERSVKKEMLKDFANRKYIYLVAEIDGKLVGYALGSYKKDVNIYFETSIRGKAHALVVDKKYRGKGVAKALIKKREEWFKSKKCEYVFLTVFATNPAVGFHEKQGYKPYVLEMGKKL
jgi:GNAT superfamily N-acetyltransferase